MFILFSLILGVSAALLVILFRQNFNTVKHIRWQTVAGLSLVGVFVLFISIGMGSKIVIFLGALIAIGCLWGVFRNLQLKRITDDLPLSKTLGVFIGFTKLKGTAESDTPLTSYLAGVECVQYSWKIDEHWSRIVTYKDSDGHQHTRKESGWTTLGKGGYSPPFYLKDDTGIIRILPESATMEGTTVFDQTYGPNSPVYFGKGPQKEIANSDHRRRFIETAIHHHATLYITGKARERQDVVAAEIAFDKESPVFLISTLSEKQISANYNLWFWLWSILGIFVAMGTAYFENSGRGGSFVLAIILYLFVLLASWVWTVYNSLINLRNNVKRAWAQIDIQLKRRYDLIPNLIQVVKEYSDYENKLQELISKLRSQSVAPASNAETLAIQGLAPLLEAVVEQYPELKLKANDPFVRLQNSLIETEERIALARDYFNTTTTFYNTRLETNPDRYIGNLAKLTPQNLLKSLDIVRAPVQVNLDNNKVEPPPQVNNDAAAWNVQPETQTQSAQPQTSISKYCGSCGKNVDINATICPSCGAKMPSE